MTPLIPGPAARQPPDATSLGRILNCKDATRLISRELDAPLPLGRRLLLRVHLFWCDACRDFVRQAMLLRDAMRRYRS